MSDGGHTDSDMRGEGSRLGPEDIDHHDDLHDDDLYHDDLYDDDASEDEVEADLANDDKWLRFRLRLGLWTPDKEYLYQIHRSIKCWRYWSKKKKCVEK